MLNDKALHMKLDTQLYNDLKLAADSMHMSLASLVRMACSEWLGKNSKLIRDVELDAIFSALPNIKRQ